MLLNYRFRSCVRNGYQAQNDRCKVYSSQRKKKKSLITHKTRRKAGNYEGFNFGEWKSWRHLYYRNVPNVRLIFSCENPDLMWLKLFLIFLVPLFERSLLISAPAYPERTKPRKWINQTYRQTPSRRDEGTKNPDERDAAPHNPIISFARCCRSTARELLYFSFYLPNALESSKARMSSPEADAAAGTVFEVCQSI